MARNKKWSAVAKFEIALQAIKGDTTINEICTRYQVSPSQVHAWKKQLLEEGKELFDKSNKKKKVVALLRFREVIIPPFDRKCCNPLAPIAGVFLT